MASNESFAGGVESRDAHGGAYAFTTIDAPSSVGFTEVLGVSASGALYGHYLDAAGDENDFVDVNGHFTTVNDPLANPGFSPTAGTAVFAATPSGAIVGEFGDAVGFNGFIDNGGVFTTIADPAGVPGSTFVGLINNRGEIDGAYVDAAGVMHGYIYHDGPTRRSTSRARPAPTSSASATTGTSPEPTSTRMASSTASSTTTAR